MSKPPFRVEQYTHAKYKFLVRGKVLGRWKRRYFLTENEALAFAEEQNAKIEKENPPGFPCDQLNGPTKSSHAAFSPPAQRHNPIRPNRTDDFAELVMPVYRGPRIERYLGDSWCMHLP